MKQLLSCCQRPCMLLTACLCGFTAVERQILHLEQNEKRESETGRSMETQNWQCQLRKLKSTLCEVSFSSDSNENKLAQ